MRYSIVLTSFTKTFRIMMITYNLTKMYVFQAPYEFAVNEDHTPGSQVFSNITVTDKDTTGSNIEVECESLPIYPNACDVFKIEAVISEQNLYQGAIVLQKKLNYTEQQLYEFILKATVRNFSKRIKRGFSIIS